MIPPIGGFVKHSLRQQRLGGWLSRSPRRCGRAPPRRRVRRPSQAGGRDKWGVGDEGTGSATGRRPATHARRL